MKKITFITITLITIIGWSLAIFNIVRSEDNIPFDHSACQYPERSTNPPDGCDNTDPCDPADAAKGGSGECDTPEVPIQTLEQPTEQQPVDNPEHICK